jgi:hypothetical protein
MRTATQRRKQIAMVGLAALAVTAIAAPNAGARPIDYPQGTVSAQFADQPLPAGINAGLGPSSGAAAASVPQVRAVEAPSSGFDWGDAEIGAAAMLGLLGLVTGAGVLVARRGRASRAPAVS